MKKFLMACAAALFIFSGCDLLNDGSNSSTSGDDNKNTYRDKWYDLVNEDVHTPSIDRGILTYGDHNYELKGEIDFDFDPATFKPHVESTLEFSNIPSGFTEFKAVYENYLGKTPQGVASMVPMLLEIYCRDYETGEKCLRLIVSEETKFTNINRAITDHVARTAEQAQDSYRQRYLPAANLVGAKWQNDYAPTEPYSVEMGPAQKKPATTTYPAHGTMYYLNIYAGGWDSPRSVEIFLPLEEELYTLNACSSCYMTCTDMVKGHEWQGLK